MKSVYISPKIEVVVVCPGCEPLAGSSTGDAVSSEGTQVVIDDYRTDGDAGNAASRDGGFWDDEE